MQNFEKSKFIKAKTFATALKHLSNMVQENDGDVFYIADILDNIKNKINTSGDNYIIFANTWKYYEYNKCEYGYFRLQIELNFDIDTYISCGYQN